MGASSEKLGQQRKVKQKSKDLNGMPLLNAEVKVLEKELMLKSPKKLTSLN